ncbi:MAG: hypothetical protein EOM61_05255 [Bacteroidia bacterium]|nr:hypothetical protein [Bacteroidia bacterium]
MRKLSFFMLLLLLLGACGGNKSGKGNVGEIEGEEVSIKDLSKNHESRRYPVKSGVIRSVSEAVGVKTTMVTYFDKWGEWEVIESTTPIFIAGTDVSSHKLEIIKGDEHWKIDLKEKTGNHYNQKRAKSAMGIDVEAITDEILGKMKMEKLGSEDYLGYKCEKFRIVGDKGMDMEYLMYGNMMMSMEGEAMGFKTTVKVTSFEVGNVPKEKFEVPEGILFTEGY